MASILVVYDHTSRDVSALAEFLAGLRGMSVRSVGPSLKESAFGADLTLCSCAAYRSAETAIRRAGGALVVLIPRDEWQQWIGLAGSAADFMLLPAEKDEILARIQRLMDRQEQREVTSRVSAIEVRMALTELVGDEPAFVCIKETLPTIASCDASVMIAGETGTGKELVARGLHYLGPRAGGPFLAVNCGAIPLELFESELFGHARGAFTGALRDRRGYLTQADGGTLFLDEIDAMPVAAQVKLLRALQSRTFQRVGSERTETTDVRIVAATNADLGQMVAAGKFRADLYYRLNVIPVHLPPLRERRGDIPKLVRHFLARFALQRGGRPREMTGAALEALSAAPWTGNVRELENMIQRAVVMTREDPIDATSLVALGLPAPHTAASATTFAGAKRTALRQFECSYLVQLLKAHGGNLTHAAREAGTDRRVLGRLIKRLNLEEAAHAARWRGTE